MTEEQLVNWIETQERGAESEYEFDKWLEDQIDRMEEPICIQKSKQENI